MTDERAGSYLGTTLVVAPLALVACLMVESAQARTLVLAATLVVFAALEYNRSRNVLSPMVIVTCLFGWLYVAKPLHVFTIGTISSGTAADAITVTGLWHSALSEALAAVTVTICIVFMAFQVVVARGRPTARRLPQALDAHRYGWAAAAVVVVDVLAFGVLVQSAGGLEAYVSGLALRSESLAGMSFLTLATVPLNLVILIGLTARLRGENGAPGRLLLIALVAVALASALLTGGRASLITSLVLPIVVVLHYAHRRIGPLLAAGMATVGLLVSVSLGALLRDTQFSRVQGMGPVDHVQARLSSLHEHTVGGVEAVPFDSLVRLMGAQRFQDLAWQGGGTYQAIVTWPIPRALWAEKPAGGGNAWFTETYVPRFYGDAKVESSISFVGENYANFGWVGILVGALAMGLLIGHVHARLTHTVGTFHLPLYATLLGFLLPAFRGDAYHNVTSVIFALAVWFALRRFLGVTEVVWTQRLVPVLRVPDPLDAPPLAPRLVPAAREGAPAPLREVSLASRSRWFPWPASTLPGVRREEQGR